MMKKLWVSPVIDELELNETSVFSFKVIDGVLCFLNDTIIEES